MKHVSKIKQQTQTRHHDYTVPHTVYVNWSSIKVDRLKGKVIIKLKYAVKEGIVGWKTAG